MAKYQLPEMTPERLELLARQAAAEDRTVRYVTPIYADDNNTMISLGSGVLLQIQQDYFLITAAHVIDEHKNTTLYVLAQKHFLAIQGPVLTTEAPPSGRKDDPLDIAVLHLDSASATHLRAHRDFLDITHVDPSDKPYVDGFYTITGYPSTKQQPPKNGVVTITPVRFTSILLPPEQYPKPFVLGTHFAIPYNKKQQLSRQRRIETPPAPQGISGGGVFRMGRREDFLQGTNTETLVGIAIEVRPGAMICTNITVALELIRSGIPTLDPHIPRSTYVKIDTQHRWRIALGEWVGRASTS